MKILSFSLFLLIGLPLWAQQEHSSHRAEIRAFQEKMNREFADSATSPLTEKDRRNFEGLDFFLIDSNYRVKAYLERTPNEKPFRMATSTDRQPVYRKYGELIFHINGKQDTLSVFQNINLIKREELKDYLFLPFTDHTNGFGSYGGGRYLDLRIPEDDSLLLDFNKAYSPYCEYNSRYSCPIPPEENSLQTEIKAGVKAFEEH